MSHYDEQREERLKNSRDSKYNRRDNIDDQLGFTNDLAVLEDDDNTHYYSPSKVIKYDNVTKPKHYNNHVSGIECVQIAEHMGYLIGNVIKYCWRYKDKGGLEDLKKARWYLDREISNQERAIPESKL